MRSLLAIFLAAAPLLALANDGDLPPEAVRAIAQGHYTRGAALYEATRYEAALREFEAAQSVAPTAALVFNIARALDRLERRAEAISAYQHFLAEDSTSPNASFARERVASLQPKPAVPPILAPPPAPPAPTARRFLIPALVGSGALAVAAIGGGLLGSAVTDYNTLSAMCAPACPEGAAIGVQVRERAGIALLGIASAAVVADVIAFIVIAKRKR